VTRAAAGVDPADRRILTEIQADGRLTLYELSTRTELTVSTCHRRLRALERSGAIRGYRARLDPRALGLEVEAVVFVTMAATDPGTVGRFEAAVDRVGEVRAAQRLLGDPDYLLRVVVADLGAFHRLHDGCLRTLPGVARLSSTLVLATPVDDRGLAV
jgi:DNA-binding Lrp family transcriptional regulator